MPNNDFKVAFAAGKWTILNPYVKRPELSQKCTKLGWVGWVLGMSYGDKAGSGGPRVLGAKSWWVGRGSHHALHNFFSLPPAWLKLFKLYQSTFTFLRQINSYFTSSLSSIIKIQSINVMKIIWENVQHEMMSTTTGNGGVNNWR